MSPARPPREPWWADRSDVDLRPPAAHGPGSRRPFGETWWGRAWITALEGQARLDRNRLSRGRGYARRGTVRTVELTPGRVIASVQGTRPTPYDVVLGVRAFSDAEWERVLRAIANRLGHLAALLDGELAPEVVDDVAGVGLALLPGPTELQPSCSCPDIAIPCKHAAAVCYLVAETLDHDPFALLHLRGRRRDEIISALRALRAGPAGVPSDRPKATVPGVLASTAFASWSSAVAPAMPSAPLPPARYARPTTLAIDAPPGYDAAALAALVADAAARAWAVATGSGEAGLDLTREEDLARRASTASGAGLPAMAKRAGMPARDLAGWALAWRHGGADGLRILRQPWAAPADTMAAGRSALLDAETPGRPSRSPRTQVEANRVTLGRRQLRLAEDGRWYLFQRVLDRWELAGPPASEPTALLRRPDSAT